MITRRHLGAICCFLLLGLAAPCSAQATEPESAGSLYLSKAKFHKLAAAALAWAGKHPHSPDSPRLLLRVIMAAKVRGDDPTDLGTAERQMLLDFPDSTEARYFLAGISDTTTPGGKRYRQLVTALLQWFTYHPNMKNCKALDGVIRNGLRRFGIKAVYNNNYQDALLCYLVAHRAGDNPVANEMLGATEPSSSDWKSPKAVASAEVREVVIERGATAIQRLGLLERLAQNEPASLLERYYLHLIPAAERSRGQILQIHVEELILNGHYRRALALLASHHRATPNAHLEFLPVYCDAVLGRSDQAAVAAKRLRTDFPKSAWTRDASELTRVVAEQDAAEGQVAGQILQFLHWAGDNVRDCEFRAALRASPKMRWRFYAGLAGSTGNIEVWENGILSAALAWDPKAIRLFDSQARRSFQMPVGATPPIDTTGVSPAAKIAGFLAAVGTPELSARGLLAQYAPAWLKTYAGAMRVFHDAHRHGVFFTRRRAHGSKTSVGLLFAGISTPKWIRVSAAIDSANHALTLKYGNRAKLSLIASSSPHFAISQPKWPAGNVVQQKKSMPLAIRDVSILLPEWLGAFDRLASTVNMLQQGNDHDYIAALKTKALAKYPKQLPRAFSGPGTPLPPHFSASASQRAGGLLTWCRREPSSTAAPEKLFSGLMLARLANNMVVAGDIERRLVLFYGSSLQGRYDLSRFSTPAQFGNLVQAILKHNAAKMTRKREVAILRVIYYGLQEFSGSQRRLDVFGTTNRTGLIFCEALALKAGWTDMASQLRQAIVSMAASNKKLASVWHCMVRPGTTAADRIANLANIRQSKITQYLAIFLLRMSHRRHSDPKLMRAAELLYAETGHLHRACAYADKLDRRHLDSGRTEFIRAYCQLRLGKPAAARQTALAAAAQFPKSPWVRNLDLLASDCATDATNFQSCVRTVRLADRWLLRKATGFEITCALKNLGKPALAAYLAADRGFIQVYGTLNGKPFVAMRLRSRHLEILSPDGPKFKRYNSNSIHFGILLSIHRHIENGWEFGFWFPFSTSAYSCIPLAQQLRQYHLHNTAGIGAMLVSIEKQGLTLCPKQDRTSTAFTLVQFSFHHPAVQRISFRTARSGRPILLESRRLTLHFHFLTEKDPHFRGLAWPNYPSVAAHAQGLVLCGQVLSELLHSASAAYKLAETPPAVKGGAIGAKSVESASGKPETMAR